MEGGWALGGGAEAAGGGAIVGSEAIFRIVTVVLVVGVVVLVFYVLECVPSKVATMDEWCRLCLARSCCVSV